MTDRKENIRAHRETLFLWKIQTGTCPSMRQSIHVRGHELKKRPSRPSICISTTKVSLCLVKRSHSTGS